MVGRLLGGLIDYEVGVKETTQDIKQRQHQRSTAILAQRRRRSLTSQIMAIFSIQFSTASESNPLSDDLCRKQEFVVRE
jgi:hypothetical protein